MESFLNSESKKRDASIRIGSHQQQRRLFEQVFQSAEELGTDGAVEDAVVAAEGHGQRLAGDDLPVLHDGFGDRGPDGENGGVRRIDDRGEFRDAHHAEIGDAERAAGVVVRR